MIFVAVLVVAPDQPGRELAALLASNFSDVIHCGDPVVAARYFSQTIFESVVCFVSPDFDPMLVCSALRVFPPSENRLLVSVQGTSTPLFLVSPAPGLHPRIVLGHYDATAIFAADQTAELIEAIRHTTVHEPVMLRALFVDDNEDVRNLGRLQILKGYDVTTAANANEAMRAFESGDIDLVLTDYQLGRGSVHGGELLKQIRQLDQITPVLVMSNAMRVDLACELLEAGATDAFLKRTNAATRDRVERAVRHAFYKSQSFTAPGDLHAMPVSSPA